MAKDANTKSDDWFELMILEMLTASTEDKKIYINKRNSVFRVY